MSGPDFFSLWMPTWASSLKGGVLQVFSSGWGCIVIPPPLLILQLHGPSSYFSLAWRQPWWGYLASICRGQYNKHPIHILYEFCSIPLERTVSNATLYGFIQSESHKTDLQIALHPPTSTSDRLALNFQSSCLGLLCAEVTGMQQHTL